MNNTATLSPELYQATQNLIEHLLASETFLVYQQSQTAMNSDSEARGLLEFLSTLQTGLRYKQSANNVMRSDIDILRDIQTQVMANPIIMAYAQSQQDAVNFLREVNQEISLTLGMDFAALAKHNTCLGYDMQTIIVQIIGAQVACAEGMKDTWREVSIWVAGQLKAHFGDGVQVKYYDLFDADCPPMPANAQLPLVMVDGEVISSGGKISVPVIRLKIDSIIEKQTV